MTKNKMKLTGNLSLKEVALDSSQFYIPKKVMIDFSQARPRFKFKDGKATETVEGYVLAGIDERTAEAVNQGIIDQEDVKAIKIEVLGSFEDIEKAVESASVAFVEVLDYKVKADWVDGRNPGYKAVKLVASGLKFLG